MASTEIDQDIRDAVNWDENSQSLHCPGLEVDELPSFLASNYSGAVSLDVSFGTLSNFVSLRGFSLLRSLVCDQNEVVSLTTFPVLEHLDTLSLNKNNVTSLPNFLRDAQEKFPKLSYLSMIGNPCCPSELTGGTESEYAEYRGQVLAKLPLLKFLDSEKVVSYTNVSLSPTDNEIVTVLTMGRHRIRKHKGNAKTAHDDDLDE